MNKILLVYAASKFTAKIVPNWKLKNRYKGEFYDLMILGEPLDIFSACDRPYLKFIQTQIKNRIISFGINKVIVLSSKFDTIHKTKCLDFIQHYIDYELVPIAQKNKPEYMYKQMIMKY